ncbi:calcium/sodium antiporter [Mariniflexile soesokkakense]|uniref:Calcium/sodium antiporter n=1 Tax=Mariniflexile soesokkakense TaxID=1343160 RepID=A0ABV0ADE1_9FLAO
MLFSAFFVLLGFVLLIKGADWLVNGASILAKRNNIPDLAIGLTIVAFGTSAPELIVNSVASYENHSDIVLGNIIGSNNFNLFMILGLVGFIFPITVQSSTVWKEIPISLFGTCILLILSNDFFLSESLKITRWDGFVLFSLFIGFLAYIYMQLSKVKPEEQTKYVQEISTLKIWAFILVGLTGLVLGGKLVVDNAISIATNLGISEKVIGLTIIAAGTSLPELITSVVAAVKKNSDIAIGNIIGSNIFNIFLILSMSAFVRPIQYSKAFNTDLYLLIAGTIFLFIAMFTGKIKKLDRWEAAILLITFIIYTSYLISNEV